MTPRAPAALAASFVFSLIACAQAVNEPTSPPEEPAAETGGAEPDEADALAAKLALWLEGRFDSEAQAAQDPEYLPISLVVCSVEAPDIGDRVLYVEQALVGAAPYRQRLYAIEAIDNETARSRIFELVAAKSVVGTCGAASRRSFRASDVTARDGCDVEMRWVGDSFVGHTSDARWDGTRFVADPAGPRCSSSLQSAAHTSSAVDLRADRLVSWDRGFDESGAQVWGAARGGYEFVRKTPLAE
jgi:hypothetical protein